MIPLIGVVIAFSLMLIMLQKNISLGLSISTAALVLAATSGLSPGEIIVTLAQTVTSVTTIEMLLTVLGITILSALLKGADYLEQSVTALCDVTQNPKAVTLLAPCMTGLMPVPGGAIVSAPLVDRLGETLQLAPRMRAAINMVFRHVWFLVFPFNPYLVIAVGMAGFTVGQVIPALALPAAMCAIAGYLFLFKGVKSDYHPSGQSRTKALFICIKTLSPLIVALASYAVLPILMPFALLLGIITGVILGTIDGKASPILTAIKRHGILPDLLLTILAVMIMREFLIQLDQLPSLVLSMVDRGIPIEPFMVALPLTIAFVSSSMSTAVVTCFPLFLSAAGSETARLGFTSLLYSFAFIGHMLSPAHPCAPLTASYFKVSFMDMVSAYIPPLIVTGIGGIIVYILLTMS